MLKPFTLRQKDITLSNEQTITLYEPTVIQIQNTNRISDDTERMKKLIIEVSKGELTLDDFKQLPWADFNKLLEAMTGWLSAVDEKN